MENKRAHLNMIQAIINRMSVNSFLLKGWSVVLVSVLFALAARNSQVMCVYLAYFPAIAFWGLDGYFLRQERLFRKLYDRVRGLDEVEVDFSMNTSFFEDEVKDWTSAVLSKTLLAFHGTVFGSILVVVLILLFNR